MPIITLVIILCVIGFLLWFINTKVTIIDPQIKQLINIVVLIATVLWLLSVFGLLGSLDTIRVPTRHG